MSAVIQNEYTGNGSTTTYSFTFPYLKTSDIKASLDGVDTTAFTLPNATTLQFNTAPTNGAKIKIFRETGVDNLTATFYAGSAIKSEDLNDNFTQNLYKTQEVGARSISALGGTMTGNFNLGLDADITFEGSTDNANETTLTVANPTADRTITLPDVTGTVVTTGDTGTVATGMIAADAVTTAKIAADAINGTKIADDSINSEHYVDGSIDSAHLADQAVTGVKIAGSTVTNSNLASNSVTTAKIQDSHVTTAKIAADAITNAKIADNSIDSEHYVDGSIDNAHLADNSVTQAKMADDSVGTAELVDGSVDTARLADNSVTLAKMADTSVGTAELVDDAVTSNKIADGSIDTVHIGSVQVTDAKLASNSVTTAKISDANVTTAKIADNAITIGKIGCEQTTLSDSDSHIPTSGAVIDYVAAQLAPLGGFEAIANEQSFPNTQPAAGVVISIADAGGLAVSNSGTASGQTVGGTTVNITGIASNFNGTTVAAGIRFLVASTGSGQNYTYHKATLKEDDLLNLSGDINDFAERYRVGSSNPTSSLDNGDLFFNTSTGKMLVYNGTNTAWEEVQSIGNFFISTLSPAFDGSTQNFTITNAPTNAEQILLVINGVVQKPNSGTSAPSEGFALDGSTVKLGAAPATGSTYHAVVIGSTVNIGTPSNNTVTTAILQDDSVTQAKIAAGAVGSTELAANAVITSKIPDNAVTTSKIADNAVTAAKLASGAADLLADTSPQLGGNLDTNGNNITFGDSSGGSDDRLTFGAGTDLEIFHNGSNNHIDCHTAGQDLYIRPTKDVYIQDYISDDKHIKMVKDGAVELYHDNTKRFETYSAGCLFTGNLKNTNDGADQAIYLGASDDLGLYHDGSDSYIENSTGNLNLRVGGENGVRITPNASVNLYYNNNQKLNTANGGVEITGTCTATAFSGDGSALTGITSFVSGMIILWSGAENAIPSGWVLCNGSNSTPDLRDRFVIGAGNSYSVGATGGATTDTINISSYTSNAAQQTGNVRGVDNHNGTYLAFKTHAHQFSVQATIDTVPPYYALCYIMKT